MFFDDFPRFLETSTTASGKQRLNIRHEAMIRQHSDLLRGKRVLDIASHDGRWSFAALKTAGAAHVTGVEARSELVANATETFQHYEADPATYRFVNADLFHVLADPAAYEVEVDVVMCLGFMYHTLRYSELLNGIRRLSPSQLLLDTAVYGGDGRVIRLFGEDTSKQSASFGGELAHEGHMLTGRPTVSALEMMMRVHGYQVDQRFDWPAFLDQNHPKSQAVNQYRTGRRITWVCRPI